MVRASTNAHAAGLFAYTPPSINVYVLSRLQGSK